MKIVRHSLILFFPVLFGLNACSNSQAAGAEPANARQVRVAPIEMVDHQKTVFAFGRLSSSQEARLSFKTGGVIHRVLADDGQQVRKGQVLAELRLDEIRAQNRKAELGKEKAEIDLANARLALQLAQRDYDNALGLYRDSVATLEQLQNAEVQLDNARNQLEAAQTGLQFSMQDQEVAGFNLEYSRILAPADGKILRRLAEPNEIVGPGKPVFLFGSDEHTQVIKVNVTDRDVVHLSAGDKALVRFDAWPGDVFSGAVRQIAGMADPYTGTYEVEVGVDPGVRRLLSGFIGRVELQAGAPRSLWRIPVEALLSGAGKQGAVYLVKNGRAVRQTIEIFELSDEQLLLNAGLTAGDEVIVSGAAYLEDGQPVQVLR